MGMRIEEESRSQDRMAYRDRVHVHGGCALDPITISTVAGGNLLRSSITKFSNVAELDDQRRPGVRHNAQYYLKNGLEWYFKSYQLLEFYSLGYSACIFKFSNWGGYSQVSDRGQR